MSLLPQELSPFRPENRPLNMPPGTKSIRISLMTRRVSENGPDEFQWAHEQTGTHFGPIFGSAEAAAAGMAAAFREHTESTREQESQNND